MEGTIGEIRLFAGNFAPRSWAFCDGQLLAISSNTALFSIIGTIYGGDGRSTMALPDLRGRAAVGEGTGPGLSPYPLGNHGGSETTQLSVLNLPAHNHVATLHAEFALGSSKSPANNMLAGNTASDEAIYAPYNAADNVAMGSESITVSNTGGNQPFNNVQPFLALHYIICLQGVYPSRS